MDKTGFKNQSTWVLQGMKQFNSEIQIQAYESADPKISS